MSIFNIILPVLDHIQRVKRQRKCDHPSFWESRSCDAICLNCNKNLGFIDDARKSGKKEILKPLGYYR